MSIIMVVMETGEECAAVGTSPRLVDEEFGGTRRELELQRGVLRPVAMEKYFWGRTGPTKMR